MRLQSELARSSHRRHHVYEILPGEALDPAAVANWFVGLAPAAIHLANDATEELEFVELLPNGVRAICIKTCLHLITICVTCF